MTITLNSYEHATCQPSWFRLDCLYSGGEDVVRQGLPHSQLSPTWQMLLLGDGSPTRHLQLLTGEKTAVDVIDMSIVKVDLDDPPEQIEAIAEPRILRQVWLKTASGKRLAYAASWWALNQIDEYLQNRSLPIWDSLSSLHLELYRDIRGLYYGYSSYLNEHFAEKGPFWGRHYIFWHNQQPLTLIYEVFSPSLKEYLGEITRD